jgi:hypothetical protein
MITVSTCSYNTSTLPLIVINIINNIMALQPFVGPWPLLQFLDPIYAVDRAPWRVISTSYGRYLHTEQHKHRIISHTDIHALSGIRTHDPRVRASKDSSCLRPRGHCDRPRPLVRVRYIYLNEHFEMTVSFNMNTKEHEGRRRGRVNGDII